MNIKQKHLLSLLQTGFTTVNVAYANAQTVGMPPPVPGAQHANRSPVKQFANPAPWEEQAKQEENTYVYKMKLDARPTVGDNVILEVRGRLVVAQIRSVDAAPQIDPDAEFEYKWIVQKVDMSGYRQVLEDEKAFNDALLEIEREKQRAKLLEQFTNQLGEGSHAKAMFDAAVGRLSLPNGQQGVAMGQPTGATNLHWAMPTPVATPPERNPISGGAQEPFYGGDHLGSREGMERK